MGIVDRSLRKGLTKRSQDYESRLNKGNTGSRSVVTVIKMEIEEGWRMNNSVKFCRKSKKGKGYDTALWIWQLGSYYYY